VAECSGENVFAIFGERIVTPPRGNILQGITRSTVIQLARAEGYEVDEQPLELEELLSADEAFMTGTAAEVTPMSVIGEAVLTEGAGPITAKLRDAYQDVVHGRLVGGAGVGEEGPGPSGRGVPPAAHVELEGRLLDSGRVDQGRGHEQVGVLDRGHPLTGQLDELIGEGQDPGDALHVQGRHDLDVDPYQPQRGPTVEHRVEVLGGVAVGPLQGGLQLADGLLQALRGGGHDLLEGLTCLLRLGLLVGRRLRGHDSVDPLEVVALRQALVVEEPVLLRAQDLEGDQQTLGLARGELPLVLREVRHRQRVVLGCEPPVGAPDLVHGRLGRQAELTVEVGSHLPLNLANVPASGGVKTYRCGTVPRMSADELARALAALETAPGDPDQRLETLRLAARAGRLGDAIDTALRARGSTPDEDPDPALVEAMAALGHGLGEPRNFPRLPELRGLTQVGGLVAGIREDRVVVVAEAPEYAWRELATTPPGLDAFGREAEASVADLRLSPTGDRLLVALWSVTQEDLEEDAAEVEEMQALTWVDVKSGEVLRHLPASRARNVLRAGRDPRRVLLAPDLRLLDLESGEEHPPWLAATGPDHVAGAAQPGPGPDRITVLLLRRGWTDLSREQRDPRLVVLDPSVPGSSPLSSEEAPGAVPLLEDASGGAPWLWFPTDHARRFQCASWSPGESASPRHPVTGEPGAPLHLGGGQLAIGPRLLDPPGSRLTGVLPASIDDAPVFHVDPREPVPAAYAGRVQLTSPGTGELQAWRDRHRKPVTHLALDGAGRLHSRSDFDGEERTWDLATGEVVDARWRRYAPGSLHPELFTQVAPGYAEDTWAYRVVRRADGECVAAGEVAGSWDPPRAGTLSPTGDRVLLASHTARAVLVDAAHGDELWRHPQVGVHGAIGGFHPDGSRLVYAYPRGSSTEVRVIDPTRGELLAELAQGPDLRDMRGLLASSSPDRWLLVHGAGTLLVELAGDGASHPGPAAFVPGTGWLVVADGDGVVHLRDEAGDLQGRFDPGFGRFGALTVAPGPELLAASRHYIRRLGWPEGWPDPKKGDGV
jgi:hypothetical protein